MIFRFTAKILAKITISQNWTKMWIIAKYYITDFQHKV